MNHEKNNWCALAGIVNTLKEFKIKMTQERLLKRIQIKFPNVTGEQISHDECMKACKEIAQENVFSLCRVGFYGMFVR